VPDTFAREKQRKEVQWYSMLADDNTALAKIADAELSNN